MKLFALIKSGTVLKTASAFQFHFKFKAIYKYYVFYNIALAQRKNYQMLPFF